MLWIGAPLLANSPADEECLAARLAIHPPTIARMQVSVIGSGPEHEQRAEEVGRLLGERGCTLVCGGRGEVMAAAARGAKSAGGTAIGILPGETRDEAAQFSTARDADPAWRELETDRRPYRAASSAMRDSRNRRSGSLVVSSSARP